MGEEERSQQYFRSMGPNDLTHRVDKQHRSCQLWALLSCGSHPDQLPHTQITKASALPQGLRLSPPVSVLFCCLSFNNWSSSGHIINVTLPEATSLPYPTASRHPNPLICSVTSVPSQPQFSELEEISVCSGTPARYTKPPS